MYISAKMFAEIYAPYLDLTIIWFFFQGYAFILKALLNLGLVIVSYLICEYFIMGISIASSDSAQSNS